jgi:CspA family cold shock protein
MVSMATGRIIRFSQMNGYGFIEPDDGSEDVFVHINDAGPEIPALHVGMRVEYNILKSDRGLRAADLRIIPAAAMAQSAAPSPVRPIAPVATTPPPAPTGGADDDDTLIEVVAAAEYEREITDILIDTIGTITAAEIVDIRKRLVKSAADRGWLD